MTVTVVVADDDPDYRLLVRLALDGDPETAVVGETSSAADLAEVVAAAGPDLVLLDGSLPGAIAAATRVRAQFPSVRVVITSSLPAAYTASTVAAADAVASLAKDIPAVRMPQALRDLGGLANAAERALRTTHRALPRADASARESRRLAQAALDGWCDEDVLSAVELLISELATNSVRHAESDIDVRIAVGATTVRIEVADRSARLPEMRTPGDTDTGGRGLRIVDEVATRWGVDQRRTGKCVWFELPRVQEPVP